MLVDERNKWRKEFEGGDENLIILNEYRKNRESESWRVSREVERLCEYALYLEGLL
jgi:hypothetical protein